MSHPHGAVRTADATRPPSSLEPSQDDSFDGLVAGTLRSVQQVRTALPAETTAWDPDYLARVTVDRRGLAVGVRVVDDWHRRVAPGTLADAVTAAAGAASRALDERARVAFENAVGPGASRASSGPPEPVGDPRTARAAGEPRPLDEVAEDSIGALAAVSHPSFPTRAVTAPVGLGTAMDGGVEVQVGAGGLLACTLRGRRVATADGVALSTALNEAVRAALADLDQQVGDFTPPHTEELLAEVFAYLSSPDFLPDRTARGGHA